MGREAWLYLAVGLVVAWWLFGRRVETFVHISDVRIPGTPPPANGAAASSWIDSIPII